VVAHSSASRRRSLARERDAEMRDVAFHHGEELVLAAAWKPSQSPKRSESDTFSSTASPGLIAVERSLVDHVARHQVPPVLRSHTG